MTKKYRMDEIYQAIAPQPAPPKRGRPRKESKVISIDDARKTQPEPEAPVMGRLMKIKNASAYLNELYDGGYSMSEIRGRIKDGTWQRGREWRKTGGIYKVDVDAIARWQAEQ